MKMLKYKYKHFNMIMMVLFLILGIETALSMAINMNEDNSISHPHHRSRRAIASSHNLLVYATPYLDLTYYFGPSEDIMYEIRAAFNGTGTDITNIEIKVSSEFIDFTQSPPIKGDFTNAELQGTEAVFTLSTLGINEVRVGNVSGKTKDTLQPLDGITLKLNATAKAGGDDIQIFGQESSPKVYGNFPEINMTRDSNIPLSVYSTLAMSLKMVLPEDMEFDLLIELTTNIEDYVFMEIKEVTETVGSQITRSVNELKHHTSQLNQENDRVELNFGKVKTPTGASEEDRAIEIKFDVIINDHEEVANDSVHYFGAGAEIGSGILWVEQYVVRVIKEDQPALNFTVSSDQTSNETRLYIGDEVLLDFNIEHSSTSGKSANDVVILVKSNYLVPRDAQTGITKKDANGTHTSFTVDDLLFFEQGQSKTGQVVMEVDMANFSPLIDLYTEVELLYKREALAKRPIKRIIDTLIAGTPLIKFDVQDNLDIVTPNMRVKYLLEVTLTKARSPLKIEIIMPKAEGKPIISILDVKLTHRGKNIKNITDTARPLYRQTTNETELNDQAVFDLGVAYNNVDNTPDSPDNKLTVEVDAIVNDFSNVTNLTSYWVGAGILGKPKMVWVGQIKMFTYIEEDARPKTNTTFRVIGDGDEYEYAFNFSHSDTSRQFMYNLTFEYYLPPYVEYVSETASPDIKKIDGYNTRFEYTPKRFHFADSLSHSIKVKLVRENAVKSGRYNFVVPLRVSFTNFGGKQFDQLTTVNRSIDVLPTLPTIPRHAKAKEHYYGRGFCWLKSSDEFYVCLNQHVMTINTACFKADSAKRYFYAMDRRIGAILGRVDGVLYGIARNQISGMKYNDTSDDWSPLPVGELPAKGSFTEVLDLSKADSYDVSDINEIFTQTSGEEKWQGTGNGLYYKASSSAPWEERAKWDLQNSH